MMNMYRVIFFNIFFILVPCILISSESFIYQQMHFISVLENIKIYIKTAPTCFSLRPPSGSLHMSLAKATVIESVEVRRYGLCGCVAALRWDSNIRMGVREIWLENGSWLKMGSSGRPL